MDTSALDRLNSALSGRYRIERELGEGGMATVYLADDLRHARKVALKVLKPELAAVVGAERFLAEIKTTANLQHPHVLPLFDSGEAGGFLFYVMPYVTGETLRDRLDRERQLPVDEAVRLATAVANALDHAHRHGVIHRDIKPGNILLQDGEPVVADFGIALAVGAAAGQRLTETGLSVGTPYYMSPEQATGDQAIGPRSDTYSVGCVLFEMLTGEPPYPGATAQAVLGKIIAGGPVSATAIRATVPAHIDAAIRRSLEKLPADRFATASDFARALADPSFRHGTAAGPAPSARQWKAVAAGFALAAAVAVSAMGMLLLRTEPPAPVIRYVQRFAEDARPVVGDGAFGTSLAISEDGSRLAYVGPGAEGGYRVWVLDRDELEGRPLTGTEVGVQPFFSPDGNRVGFIVTGSRQLKVASLGGEPPLTLVDSAVLRLGAAWGRDGYVYFCAQPDGGLYRVPATGGAMERLAGPDTARGETRYTFPDALPSGRGVLLTILRGGNAYTPEDDVAVLDLETGELRVLFRATLARYIASGHIVFVSHEGNLMAAPFDEGRLEVTGPSVPLLSDITGAIRGPDVALSRSGRLAYQPQVASTAMEIVWMDRAGRATPVQQGWVIQPAANSGPRLSPDGTRIALDLAAAEGGGPELWIKELGGPLSRLAYEGNNDGRASWSSDGRSIIYTSDQLSGSFDSWIRRADGSGAPELLIDMELPLGETRLSPDGRWLILRGNAPVNDILGLRRGVDSVPTPLVATGFNEWAPALSPDGRFMAYVADDSGRPEIYVRPFPDVDRFRVQVSADGGVEPVWAHSGQELFYKNEARQLVSVQLDTSSELRVSGRDVLFPLPPGASYYPQYTQYDVTRDGQRFLMFRLMGGEPQPVPDEFVVVENFHEELRRRLGS